MKKTIKLQIEIKDDIDKKYPNYRTNFRKKEDFMNFMINVLTPQSTEDFGYIIKRIK